MESCQYNDDREMFEGDYYEESDNAIVVSDVLEYHQVHVATQNERVHNDCDETSIPIALCVATKVSS